MEYDAIIIGGGTTVWSPPATSPERSGRCSSSSAATSSAAPASPRRSSPASKSRRRPTSTACSARRSSAICACRLRLRSARTQSVVVLAVPRRPLSDAGPDARATCEEIAQVQQDATPSSYPNYEAMLERVASVVEPTLTQTPPNVLRPGSRDCSRLCKLGRALQQLGPGDERGDRGADRRGAPDPRPLVRVGGAQRQRSPPTRSSAPSRRRRCRAPPTCSSTTSWARPTASAACGLTSRRHGRPDAGARARPRRDLGVEIRTDAEVARILIQRGGPSAASRWRTATSFAPRTSPATSTADVTFKQLLDPRRCRRTSSRPIDRIDYAARR